MNADPGNDLELSIGDVDLGHDHWLRWLPGPDVAPPPGSRVYEFGAIVLHANRETGARCAMGGFRFGPSDVSSLEPLTVAPSLHCGIRGCGDHGWIRDGAWVPA